MHAHARPPASPPALLLPANQRTNGLAGAVDDFSVAIEVEPRYADGWKRRGQARSALGDSEGALADLQKAIDLAPLFGGQDSPQVRACAWCDDGRRQRAGWRGRGGAGLMRRQRR